MYCRSSDWLNVNSLMSRVCDLSWCASLSSLVPVSWLMKLVFPDPEGPITLGWSVVSRNDTPECDVRNDYGLRSHPVYLKAYYTTGNCKATFISFTYVVGIVSLYTPLHTCRHTSIKSSPCSTRLPSISQVLLPSCLPSFRGDRSSSFHCGGMLICFLAPELGQI